MPCLLCDASYAMPPMPAMPRVPPVHLVHPVPPLPPMAPDVSCHGPQNQQAAANSIWLHDLVKVNDEWKVDCSTDEQVNWG